MTKAKKEAALPAVMTKEEQEYMASIMSSDQPASEYTGPDRLEINLKSKDADGNKRAIGSWKISRQGKLDDEGNPLSDLYFSDVAYFRPVRKTQKLIRYEVNGTDYKLAGQSIFFDKFDEDVVDTLGGTFLGRKFGRGYTDEEKKDTKHLAELYLVIFGLVKFEGFEEEYPVMYRVRGGKFAKFLDAFNSVPKGHVYSQYLFKLETNQPDGKDYWDVEITPDLSKTLPITPILDYDKEIVQFISDSNTYVAQEYRKHATTKAENIMVSNMKTVTVDLDDELPF